MSALSNEEKSIIQQNVARANSLEGIREDLLAGKSNLSWTQGAIIRDKIISRIASGSDVEGFAITVGGDNIDGFVKTSVSMDLKNWMYQYKPLDKYANQNVTLYVKL